MAKVRSKNVLCSFGNSNTKFKQKLWKSPGSHFTQPELPANSIVGFLGPNGTGKSTTIKLLLGLTKPPSGSGTIIGMDIVNDNQDIRRRVGFLAQNPKIFGFLFAWLSAVLLVYRFFTMRRDAYFV
jgi:ABC-type uncharacterized transport system ATPase subunit